MNDEIRDMLRKKKQELYSSSLRRVCRMLRRDVCADQTAMDICNIMFGAGRRRERLKRDM